MEAHRLHPVRECDCDIEVRLGATGTPRPRSAHLGSYSGETLRAMGSRYRANAPSQEKTGSMILTDHPARYRATLGRRTSQLHGQHDLPGQHVEEEGRGGALRISTIDAERFGLIDGGRAMVTTSRASVEVMVEINDRMRDGHISLPNGMGVGTSDDVKGVAPSELTDSAHRDPIAGTPFHKHVPARVHAVV